MIRIRLAAEAKDSSSELRCEDRRRRDVSRTLSDRSAALRDRFAPPAASPEPAPPPAAARGCTDLERLLRAERELEGAIAECREALDEVRREMCRQFPVSAGVH